MFGPLHVIIIQTYLCRIAASVLRKKTAINAGPVIKSERKFLFPTVNCFPIQAHFTDKVVFR